ncbi:MAG TPA: hypothetical protein VGH17_01095 [Candidatus Acidoferrales bacterium]
MKLSGVVATQVRVVGFAGFGAEILRFAQDDKNDVGCEKYEEQYKNDVEMREI